MCRIQFKIPSLSLKLCFICFPLSSDVIPILYVKLICICYAHRGDNLYALLADCSLIHYSPHWLLNMKHIMHSISSHFCQWVSEVEQANWSFLQIYKETDFMALSGNIKAVDLIHYSQGSGRTAQWFLYRFLFPTVFSSCLICRWSHSVGLWRISTFGWTPKMFCSLKVRCEENQTGCRSSGGYPPSLTLSRWLWHMLKV